MQEKFKKNSSFILNLLKSAFVGVLVSVVLVLVFAFVLKFIDLNDAIISVVDEIIKIVSIFVSVMYLIKRSPYKILYKSALVGAVYILLTFIVFSALRGHYSFGVSTIVDILLGALTGAIFAIILNIFKKDKHVVDMG